MYAAGLAVLFLLSGVPEAAQAAQAAPPAAAPAAPAPTPAAPAAAEAPGAPAVSESYTYDPGGRRDPFLNLLGAGTESRSSLKGAGPAGMTVAEISVRGVLQSRTGRVAMVQGPDNKTYIVHPGDKLADGAIKAITAQGLVIDQAVNDPLSVVKQREVRKLLRGLEDSK